MAAFVLGVHYKQVHLLQEPERSMARKSKLSVPQTLAGKLQAMSDHLSGAAEYGAATAHRLANIAHTAVHELDDVAPLSERMEMLKNVATLMKMANDASSLSLSMLAASAKKATVSGELDNDTEVDIGTLTDEQLEAHISKTAARLGLGKTRARKSG